MALHTAYITTNPEATPVIVTQHTDSVASTWIDSIVNVATGIFDLTYTGLGLTTNPVIHVQSIHSIATGDTAAAVWYQGDNDIGDNDLTSFTRLYFIGQGTNGQAPPDAFLVMLEDMETPAPPAPAEMAARIAISTSPYTPSIESQTGNWLDSVTRVGQGQWNIDYTSAGFTNPPCIIVTGGALNFQCHLNAAPTATTAQINSRTVTGAAGLSDTIYGTGDDKIFISVYSQD